MRTKETYLAPAVVPALPGFACVEAGTDEHGNRVLFHDPIIAWIIRPSVTHPADMRDEGVYPGELGYEKHPVTAGGSEPFPEGIILCPDGVYRWFEGEARTPAEVIAEFDSRLDAIRRRQAKQGGTPA